MLAEGGIVAVKGIGGYHLACRADCAETVTRLRERKARGDKPFAVLTRNLSTARLLAEIDPGEQRSLTGAPRPIVLLRRLPGAPVADTVAPGSPLLGVLLPYAPGPPPAALPGSRQHPAGTAHTGSDQRKHQ